MDVERVEMEREEIDDQESSTSTRNHKVSVIESAMNMADVMNSRLPPVDLDEKQIEQTTSQLKDGIKVKCRIVYRERNAKSYTLRLDSEESFLEILKRRKRKLLIFFNDVNDIVERSQFLENSWVRRIVHKKKLSDKNLSFSLKYGMLKREILYIECSNEKEYTNIVQVLSHLLKQAWHAYELNPSRFLVQKTWQKADLNHDGKLNRKELYSLAKRVNLRMPKKALLNHFQNADTDSDGYLQYHEFVELCRMLAKRPELDDLFDKYRSYGTDKITPQNLLRFLHKEQHETETTIDHATKLIAKYGSRSAEGPVMTRHYFSRYLFNSSNTLAHPDIYSKYEDMTQPLTHYYIASSHNTYLTGNQLRSKSSVDMYRHVLLSGCRCIELDCWDGKLGEPKITHGHTLTSRISFKEVCKCIREYAFISSEYPVILSLEVHCSVPQQEKMAQHMSKIFGSLLLLPNEVEGLDEFPSPESLKNRILLKGKRVAGDSDQYVEETDEAIEDEEPAIAQAIEEKLPPEAEVQLSAKQKPKKKVSKKLSDLIALSAKTFKPPLKEGKVYEMHSFSENRIAKFLALDPTAIAKFNLRQFSRIFPKGTRFISSNYDPTVAWNFGCQMVALNYQKYDHSMRFNAMKFKMNGGTGYLLKPSILRDHELITDVNTIPSPQYRFWLTIVSGEALPKPQLSDKGEIIDPYVIIRVYGVEPDCHNSYQTKVIWNNGFNPVWKETFEFDMFCVDLAFLRITVYDKHKTRRKSKGFLCENVIPMNELRYGYRNIPMLSKTCIPVEGASILVHNRFTKYASKYVLGVGRASTA